MNKNQLSSNFNYQFDILNINTSNSNHIDVLNKQISNNHEYLKSNSHILNNKISNLSYSIPFASNYYHGSTINLSDYNYSYYSISNKSISSNNLLFSSIYYQSLYTNDLYYTYIDNDSKTLVNTIDTEDLDIQINTINHDSLPLFFNQDYLIKIPKIERQIRRNIPKQILLLIHSDYETSVELCLLYISQLTSTYFDIKDNVASHGWKQLKAKYLQELIGGDATTYKRVREALEYEHPIHGKLLECDYKHVAGLKSFGHRLQREVLLKGVIAYKLKSEYVRKQWYHNQMLSYARAVQNPIAKNLILMYPHLELPTLVDIQKEAKRLVKSGYVTKKGKVLKFRNKHSDNYFKDLDKISFVEDAIEIYDYLVLKNGLMIPQPNEDAGGRVYDSLNLMPSWIRNLVKYKGEPLIELDYSCLHPNIACTLYGGTSEYLRHQNLADELGLHVDAVKLEHLSFFNKKVVQMKQSPLFEYYTKKEPVMMQNIIHDKIFNTEYKHKSNKHKITSKRMFQLEVDIMTSVIEKLNYKGIHVLYVFDAIYSHSNDVTEVIDIMNQTTLEYGVKTLVKH